MRLVFLYDTEFLRLCQYGRYQRAFRCLVDCRLVFGKQSVRADRRCRGGAPVAPSRAVAQRLQRAESASVRARLVLGMAEPHERGDGGAWPADVQIIHVDLLVHAALIGVKVVLHPSGPRSAAEQKTQARGQPQERGHAELGRKALDDRGKAKAQKNIKAEWTPQNDTHRCGCRKHISTAIERRSEINTVAARSRCAHVSLFRRTNRARKQKPKISARRQRTFAEAAAPHPQREGCLPDARPRSRRQGGQLRDEDPTCVSAASRCHKRRCRAAAASSALFPVQLLLPRKATERRTQRAARRTTA